ncbi:hypothetical protein [Pseudomonas typographi]|uniref:Prevent-host-death protein n=1 Tax=Pseudomonas typographi TaxID=2715964 RepID=A0ABR7Z8T9_9PSED|nr:hypothetical protein [Pseudomonas typographi]MBD1601960.1 hypothetical protein [Pseudomonas typographi]
MNKTTLSGMDIKLIRSETLPGRTMVVSPDLYDLLTNDGDDAKKAHKELLSKAQVFAEIAKRSRQ